MNYHEEILAAIAAAINAKHDAEQDVDVNDFLEIVAAGNTDPNDLTRIARRLLSKRRAPTTEEDYVAAMGLKCPSCDSTDTRVDGAYPEIGGVESQVHCDACGAHWKEWYELKGYSQLTR